MRRLFRSPFFGFALTSILALASAVTMIAAAQGTSLAEGEDEHLQPPATVVEASGRTVPPGLIRSIPERLSAAVQSGTGRNLAAARWLQTACWLFAALLLAGALLRASAVPAALVAAALFVTQPFLAAVSSLAYLRWGLALLGVAIVTFNMVSVETGRRGRTARYTAAATGALLASFALPFLAVVFALAAFCAHRYRACGNLSWKSTGLVGGGAVVGMLALSLVLKFDGGTVATILFGYPMGGWWFPGAHGWSELASWVASVPSLLADAFLFLLAAWARPLLLVSMVTGSPEPWFNPLILVWGVFILGHAPVGLAFIAWRREKANSTLRVCWVALTLCLVALAAYAIAFPRSEGVFGAAVALYFPFLCSALLTGRRLFALTPWGRTVPMIVVVLIVTAQGVDLSRAASLVDGHRESESPGEFVRLQVDETVPFQGEGVGACRVVQGGEIQGHLSFAVIPHCLNLLNDGLLTTVVADTLDGDITGQLLQVTLHPGDVHVGAHQFEEHEPPDHHAHQNEGIYWRAPARLPAAEQASQSSAHGSSTPPLSGSAGSVAA